MIQFTGNTKIKAEPVRKVDREGRTWVLGLICKCAVMLVMIFSACGLRVYFSDRTDKLERQAQNIRLEIRRTDLEIQNLVARRERMYSLKYIQSKIAQYKLDLRPTSASQIRYLKYYQVSPGLSPEQDQREVADAGRPGEGSARQYSTASVR